MVVNLTRISITPWDSHSSGRLSIDAPTQNRLGHAIREWRKKRGVSLKDAASVAELRPALLAAIEVARSAGPTALETYGRSRGIWASIPSNSRFWRTQMTCLRHAAYAKTE
jgi:hypothetical protein